MQDSTLEQFMREWHPEAYETQRIRLCAYYLWEQAGKPSGAALANWYEAERIVRSERTRAF